MWRPWAPKFIFALHVEITKDIIKVKHQTKDKSANLQNTSATENCYKKNGIGMI